MIFRFFYNCVLFLVFLGALPKFLYQLLRYGKYRFSLRQRLGIGFPDIQKGKGPLIWFHAVSVGETRALRHLAASIREKLPEATLMLTNITETGHEEGKRSLSMMDHHLFLPLDLSFIIRPIVRKIRPDLVILCETDFWYNFLNSCKEEGAQIALVNGKISKKSMRMYQTFNWYSKKIFSLIDLFCVQNKVYAERFFTLGIPEEKMAVTGNLKFDGEAGREEVEGLRDELGVAEMHRIVVLGSSHAPEEMMFLDMLNFLWNQYPIKALIVPRHPERFQEVAKLLERMAIPYIRYSQIKHKTGKEKVVLIDAMGMLRRCYAISDAALVGGSFFPGVGGHNILEPCEYNVPVLFGPYMHSQPDLEQLMLESGAGKQVSPSDIPQVLSQLFSDPDLALQMGKAGQQLLEDLKGATEKTKKELFLLSLNPS